MPCDNQALCSLEVTLDDGLRKKHNICSINVLLSLCHFERKEDKRENNNFLLKKLFQFLSSSFFFCWLMNFCPGRNKQQMAQGCTQECFIFSLTLSCFLWSSSLLDWTFWLSMLESGKYCLREDLILTISWGSMV